VDAVAGCSALVGRFSGPVPLDSSEDRACSDGGSLTWAAGYIPSWDCWGC